MERVSQYLHFSRLRRFEAPLKFRKILVDKSVKVSLYLGQIFNPFSYIFRTQMNTQFFTAQYWWYYWFSPPEACPIVST